MFAALLILSAALFAYLAPAKLTMAVAAIAFTVSWSVRLTVAFLAEKSPSFYSTIKAFALAFFFWLLGVLAAMSFFSLSLSTHNLFAAIMASPFLLLAPLLAYLIAFSIVLEISLVHALAVSVVASLVSSAMSYLLSGFFVRMVNHAA